MAAKLQGVCATSVLSDMLLIATAAAAASASTFSKHDNFVLSQVQRVLLKLTRSRYGMFIHLVADADNFGIHVRASSLHHHTT